jgi:hypothetical protein
MARALVGAPPLRIKIVSIIIIMMAHYTYYCLNSLPIMARNIRYSLAVTRPKASLWMNMIIQ